MPHSIYWYILFAGGMVILIAAIWLVANWSVSISTDDERTRHIREKYGRTDIAKKLIRKTIWAGETADQLRDSFEAPVSVKRSPFHTSGSEVWEYLGKGAELPDLHVTLKDGLVIGWVKIYRKKGKKSKRPSQ